MADNKKTCSVESCDRSSEVRGFCHKHYQRFLKHGDPLIVLGRSPRGHSQTTHRQLGYVVEWLDHPLADSRGRVMQHRRVMYDLVGPDPQPCFYCGVVLPWRTGRKVKGEPGIEVDHVDGDRTNNDPANLVLCCPPDQTRKGRQGNHRAEVLEVTA